MESLAFLGHSAGGALGAILSAVEPRLSRIAIFGNSAGPLATAALAHALTGSNESTSLSYAAADWFDPGRFVAVERRARLLVQHGRTDQIAPIAASRALFEAAAERKAWADYDCGHDVDAYPRARADRALFLDTQ